MDQNAVWEAIYRDKAETELSWFEDFTFSSLALIHATGMSPQSRIIDVGCGASRLIDLLIKQGYRSVTALDIARTALDKIRNRLGHRADQVTWEVADITMWSPSGLFDIWHDRAMFHFLVDPPARKSYAAVMAASVPLGGFSIIGTFALDGPAQCSGLPVRRYDGRSLVAEFSPDFQLVEILPDDHVTPAGITQKFQFCRMVRV